MPQHRQLVQQLNLLDLVLLQEAPLDEPALVYSFDFRNALDAANQLLEVWKIDKPVYSADVVEAEVNYLHCMQLCFHETHCIALKN